MNKIFIPLPYDTQVGQGGFSLKIPFLEQCDCRFGDGVTRGEQIWLNIWLVAQKLIIDLARRTDLNLDEITSVK